jgi:formate--tetrahydrofolate ligase
VALIDRRPAPIAVVARELGLAEDEFEPYGRETGKIDLSVLDRLAAAPDGKLICVTSMTPTKRGEGKTTTAIALADALGAAGEHPVLCLREPSLGPVFGIKGGGTGGGRAQLAASDQVNLHFTGDLHAIGAANNLLAAMVDSHVWHGNELGIDPDTITWRRCVDMDDRALRRVIVDFGGRVTRETGFDITAASEVMAIIAMSRTILDLRRRLGAITVASTFDGAPVTAEAVGAAGSMAAILTRALKPNLVETIEGRPALVHCGPFANIAHGNNSILADCLGLKLGDYVVTESGFGADMGFEKLIDIVCRASGIVPSAVVLVVTTQALKRHGGDPDGGVAALKRGAANLEANLRVVRTVGFEPVVAVNAFPGDSRAELNAARGVALDLDVAAAEITTGFERGGDGALALAEAVVEAAAGARPLHLLYRDDEPIVAKIEAVATRAYGAAGVELAPEAVAQAESLTAAGLGRLPVCMAKTHLSLSHDLTLIGAPRDFTLPVRELRPYTGAGWIVALCGDMQTMPGLPARPAAHRIDVEPDGRIVGLR